MKLLAIIFLFLSVFCFSQEIDCPVENGVIYYNESYEFRTKRDCCNVYRIYNPSKSTNVNSEKPISVISVTEGKISGIVITGNLLSVLVRKGDEFFVYADLTSTSLKKNDEVKIGDVIGTIDKKSEFSDSGEYILNFSYWQGIEINDVFDRLKCIKK